MRMWSVVAAGSLLCGASSAQAQTAGSWRVNGAIAGRTFVLDCRFEQSGGVCIDAASGAAETFANVPSVAKSGCAAAATQRHLIIAGGTTGTGVDSTVEIYDAATLERLATATLVVPRTDAVALAMPNDQILIAGGVDAAGAPVGVFELFTPPVE